MIPITIDSPEKPGIFGRDVWLVELPDVLVELVEFEPSAGPSASAGPPSMEIIPFDDAPVKVKMRFAPLIET